MKFRFITQPYQQDAVDNICKVFKGQPYANMVRYTRDLGIKKKIESDQSNFFDQIDAYDQNDDGFENAKVILNDYDILNNIRDVQQTSNYR